MTGLRKISPIAVPVAVVRATEFGARPEFRWVGLDQLYVDAKYQRDLSRTSKRLILKIVANFAWRKMKPLIVVAIGEGYHVVDGQHTAIAAATLRIPELPVFVVDADVVEKRADSFVAHNRDRISVTLIDVFKAQVTARDEDALDVVNVCRRAGVTIRVVNQQSKVSIGDTMAVGSIQGLVKRQGVQKARAVLEALVQGGRAPISAAEISAVEAAMCLVRPTTTVDEMTRAIVAVSDHGVHEARVISATDGKTHKHVLFESYMRILELQTGVHRALAS